MVKNRNKVYAYCILDDNKFIVESNIVYTWDECQNIVKGKKSRYKSFKTETEAKKWLECGAEYESKSEKQDKLIDLFAELDRDAIYFDAGTGRGKGHCPGADREGADSRRGRAGRRGHQAPG